MKSNWITRQVTIGAPLLYYRYLPIKYYWWNRYPKPGFWISEVPWWNGLNMYFFSFFAKCVLPYLIIFLKALQNFEKSSNMPKIWQKIKKSFAQLGLSPFFGWLQIPDHHYYIHSKPIFLVSVPATPINYSNERDAQKW